MIYLHFSQLCMFNNATQLLSAGDDLLDAQQCSVFHLQHHTEECTAITCALVRRAP